MNKIIPASQRTAWLLVGVSAPILSFANKIGWLCVACAAMLGMVIGICRRWIEGRLPRWVGDMQSVTAILYIGAIARECSSCWQDGANTALLPLVLLATAAFAVRDGAERGGRCCAVLVWFVIPGILMILLAGIGELEMPANVPLKVGSFWSVAPLFLLPFLNCAAVEKQDLKMAALIGMGAVLTTLWLNGEQLPDDAQNAFYEYSRGVTLFGVAERFEALSACFLTAGWFALFAYLLSAVYEIGKMRKAGNGKWGIWAAAIAGLLIMYILPISLEIAGILCVICWGFLPLGTQLLGMIKKSKKHEKNS